MKRKVLLAVRLCGEIDDDESLLDDHDGDSDGYGGVA